MERFNRLISEVSSTLDRLHRAIEGSFEMSQDLDSACTSLLNSQVPEMWRRVAYPSLKPLLAWFGDFAARTEFVRLWLAQGPPASFWLAALFFPQGFMAAVLQSFARKCLVGVDKLDFAYEVVAMPKEAIVKPPEAGVYIYGLFIEGARWDKEEKVLGDPLPGEMHAALPVIHLMPRENYKKPANAYACPVYKTSARAGNSTVGQFANFVACFDLPTTQTQDYWTLKGVAILCQLND